MLGVDLRSSGIMSIILNKSSEVLQVLAVDLLLVIQLILQSQINEIWFTKVVWGYLTSYYLIFLQSNAQDILGPNHLNIA